MRICDLDMIKSCFVLLLSAFIVYYLQLFFINNLLLTLNKSQRTYKFIAVLLDYSIPLLEEQIIFNIWQQDSHYQLAKKLF